MEKINIVWLKRDLRLYDHLSLYHASKQNEKILFIYVFEQVLVNDPHYSERHFNFILESLSDINEELIKKDSRILIAEGDILNILEFISQKFIIKGIYSHQETGLKVTYDRDKTVNNWCKEKKIILNEYLQQGVFRGIKNRKNWLQNWEKLMNQPIKKIKLNPQRLIPKKTIENLNIYVKKQKLEFKSNGISKFQKGGTKYGNLYLNTFFKKRYQNYQKHISKPDLSRKSCSRLSPYLAYGNISMRQIIQRTELERKNGNNSFALKSFSSRLRWQSHFIQKFEMECSMEFNSINKGYLTLKKPINKKYIKAWESGNTGVPIVDAAMRCLVQTGYLNFRMRSLVVSFFTHHLWQPWQACAHFLARQFLDFEPGIHYPQLQMQAGVTGINMLRIYNPIKNGKEHDPNGHFVKKWIPELKKVPNEIVHTPWEVTPLERDVYDFKIGKTYPKPIVDLQKSRKHAASSLWPLSKNALVRKEGKRILAKHTLANRNLLMR